MSLWTNIDNVELLQEASHALGPHNYTVILKHSSRCAISTMAKSRLERNPDPQIQYYLLDVIRHRNLSDLLAEETGVKHESPQSFLFVANTLADVKSHFGIDPAEISRRIQSFSQI